MVSSSVSPLVIYTAAACRFSGLHSTDFETPLASQSWLMQKADIF